MNDGCVVSQEEIYVGCGEPAEDGTRIYCFGSIGFVSFVRQFKFQIA